jgi:hypothetical protein
VSEHEALIWKKLDHLARMREYLAYSLVQIQQILPLQDWSGLKPDQHESLATIRKRCTPFSRP